MFRLIQVPLDGSPFAEHALPLAVSLAQRESVTLQIVRVHEAIAGVYLHPSGRFVAFLDQEAMDNARERLEATAASVIAVAVAHVTQCSYCIRGHTSAALRQGATAEEVMEAIWVAAEMRAGAAYAHSTLALDTIAHMQIGNNSEL